MESTSAGARKSHTGIRHIGLAVTLKAMLALLLLFGAPACHHNSGPSAPKVLLVVSNTGFFDVNVFVVRSSAMTAIRLGMVSGGTSGTFRVAESDLQPGHMMVVQVRTIGATTSWTSPALVIGVGTVARLDVITTSSGGLTQTQFYTQR